MIRTLSVIALLLALTGCESAPPYPYPPSPSPCAVSEASYACQIERYQNAF